MKMIVYLIVSLVVLAGAFFGGVLVLLRLSINPIKEDINEIRTTLNNHVTDTNKKIDDLKDSQTQSFEKIYKILLDKKT